MGTVQEVLHVLDLVYGDVESGDSVVTEFFGTSQRPDEDVAHYGTRLKHLLCK